MIVIGYQGIGKSTLANKDLRFIDLESGNFWVDGKRADDWYKPYCQIAEHLSKQGYIVFTSSHEVVRKQLVNSDEQVICCAPDLSLKDEWIEKLRIRYVDSQLEKDYKAYMNAKERFTENIREIAYSGFDVLWLTYMDYNLRDLILKCEMHIYFMKIKMRNEKEKLLEYINNPVLTDARNSMSCSKNWYKHYYAIKETFTEEEIVNMTDEEINNLVKLAENIMEALY